MLLISRKINEVIVVKVAGIEFRICVVDFRGSRENRNVRLAFDAPLSVVIDREEIHERKQLVSADTQEGE